ncbi:hypothetical protein N8590_04020 [bacterium]|nr:hypothetical protein [bacterium]
MNRYVDENGIVELKFSYVADSEDLRLEFQDKSSAKASLNFRAGQTKISFHRISATEGHAKLFPAMFKSGMSFDETSYHTD